MISGDDEGYVLLAEPSPFVAPYSPHVSPFSSFFALKLQPLRSESPPGPHPHPRDGVWRMQIHSVWCTQSYS